MLSRANPPSHITVDISDIAFPVPGDHRIRIMNAFACLYNYIALDTNAALASVPLTAVELPLASAELRYHGQVQRTELPLGVYVVCVANVRDDAMCWVNHILPIHAMGSSIHELPLPSTPRGQVIPVPTRTRTTPTS